MVQWPHPDLVTDRVTVGAHRIAITHPRVAEDLIDEREYEVDERLPYWADLWPSGRVLADALAERPLRGRTVLELGCGLGLPAITAHLAGASVLATDWYEVALEYARRNAERQSPGSPLDTMLVDWTAPPPELLARAPFDLVVGADVLYEPRHGPVLADLLPKLVEPAGEVLIADPRRPDAADLLDRLCDAGWELTTDEVRHTARVDESGALVRLHSLTPPREGPRT